jgi:hypothetical protein
MGTNLRKLVTDLARQPPLHFLLIGAVVVVPRDGHWKIRSIEVFDEKRLR